MSFVSYVQVRLMVANANAAGHFTSFQAVYLHCLHERSSGTLI